jgi:hypothetical protein
VGSVRLRWRVSINMIVILSVPKSSRSAYELENMQKKEPIGESGKGRGGWKGGKPHLSGL